MSKMARPKKAWALVWNNGDLYGDLYGAPYLYRSRRSARNALKDYEDIVCVGGEFVQRIAKVEIREVKP